MAKCVCVLLQRQFQGKERDFLSKALLGSGPDLGAWVPRQINSLASLQIYAFQSLSNRLSRTFPILRWLLFLPEVAFGASPNQMAQWEA